MGNYLLAIYDGGSDKDSQLKGFTGHFTDYNDFQLTASSSGNQMFISYKKNINIEDGALGKGFSAAFTFRKKVTFSFFNHT